MTVIQNPNYELIAGTSAFYQNPAYQSITIKEIESKTPLQSSYIYNTESKIWRVVKQIFSYLFFPIAIGDLIHSLIGRYADVLPASNPTRMGYDPDHALKSRKAIDLTADWKYKRLTVEVDGYQIDAMLMGKPSTFKSGRWMVNAAGNGGFYEDFLAHSKELKHILTEIKGNAIVFNYPGVGASSGMPNRSGMAKAHKAILNFLEDKQKGLAAKEIVGMGISIGGGVQGEALNDYEFKPDVKYVFIKDRTFSDFCQAALSVTGSKIKSLLLRIFGWNISPIDSSKRLDCPEIILQTAHNGKYHEIIKTSDICDDGIINAEASLAKALMEDPECPLENKYFIGLKENHNEPFHKPGIIAKKINDLLAQ